MRSTEKGFQMAENINENDHVFLADRLKRVKKPIMIFVYAALGLTFLLGWMQQY